MSGQVLSQSPRQGLNARQSETVERLLAAGLAELRAVGHEALTIRTVAQRAGVSPATAYTYLASKNHLFAELFWRHISSDASATDSADTAVARLQGAVRGLTARIVTEPELATAVTPALLGSDPDVARLRLKIGSEFVARFEAALRDPDRPDQEPDHRVVEVLALAFSGALLQAGMGLLTYDQITERLVMAVELVLREDA